MARQDRANPDSRNFGLRSRDMASAGRNALREGMQSHSSIATMSDRFSQFAEFSRAKLGIRDMRQLEREHILQYAERLRERCEQNQLSAATAQNQLSAVNRVLELARGDRLLNVAPVREANLPQRSNIKQVENFLSSSASYERSGCNTPALLATLPERLQVQIELQRILGLRFEEGCKLNPARLLAQVEKSHSVTIKDGTKGGRARDIPVLAQEQRQALARAAILQGRDRSLIPEGMTYKAYRTQAYESLRQAGINGFHQNRHEYARNRYQQLTRCPCPVTAGVAHGKPHFQYMAGRLAISENQARTLDQQARLQVARELGHHRYCVTNNYLG